jgi:predicted dehydrogenase
MKISVFGAGSIGRRHLSNLIRYKKKLNIDEIISYDVNEDREKLIEEKKDFKFTSNFKEAALNCDVAFVCTPTHLHINTIKKIHKFTTCHFYLEKPFSSSIKGCAETLKIIKNKKKKIAVGYMLVNHPLMKKAQQIIKSKIIGRNIFARVECGFYLPNWHPWEDYRSFYMSKADQGGGVLLDTSHEINYLQRLFGNVKETQGIVGKFSDLDITSDDLTLSILKFKNNLIAHVHLDLIQFNKERSLKIIGTKGVLKMSLTENEIQVFTNKDKKWKKIKINYNFNKIYFEQLDQLWKLIKNKKQNLGTGEEALHTMQIIEAVRSSSKSGKKIFIKS